MSTEVCAKPQASKTLVVFKCTKFVSSPVKVPGANDFITLWAAALHHHRVKDTLWTRKLDRELHVWQMRWAFLTSITGKAMDIFITSDLSLSKGAMRIARHLDNRCEMQSTLVYCVCTFIFWAELRDMYHPCKWQHKVKDNWDSGNPLPDGQGDVQDQNNQVNRRSESDN